MRIDDGRYVRAWNEPFRFTIALANTGDRFIDLPGDLTLGKDVRVCYVRTSGRFHYDLKMRSSRSQPLTIGGAGASLPSWSRTTRSYAPTPLAQVPMAGLFWTWCEVQPGAAKRSRKGSVPPGLHRSNPVLLWWQARTVSISAEVRNIGLAIERHRARSSR